jgi:hypothetical protein
MIVLATIAAAFLTMVWYSTVADAYDAERWKTDPDYCRYGAPMRDVLTWWWRMKRWLKRLWCALRDHPYPMQCHGGPDAYDDWVRGNDPFRPPNQCTHCGKVFWR